MRRGAVVSLVVIGVLAGAATTLVAVLVPWLPEQASRQREGIDFVFWLTTWICVSIFAVVAAVSLYSVWKFRARPDDDSDGPPIHGHTGIEIVWTAVPTVLVVVIAVASSVVLVRNDRAAADSLRIRVTAQQFAWHFEYPNGVTSSTLRLPVDRDVVLQLQARDVIHSFWVPEFGQKQDAVPGIETRLAITPTKVGEYPVICTELCGLGHSVMRTTAVVLEQGAYDAWLAEQEQALAGADGEDGEGGELAAGAAVFESQGCGGCHAFAPAGSQGETGPPLDGLEQRADAVGRPLDEFVRTSIVEPNAVIAPGYQADVMPHTYGELPDEQLDALVRFLVEAGEAEG